jgi:hypothetical protein
VPDLEVLVQFVGGVVQEAIVAATLGHHQMGGERDLRGAHGPHVQVVHVRHAGQRLQKGLHGMQVHAVGHAVEQQVQRLLEQTPGADHDDGRDQQADHRVQPGPAEPQRQAAGHHHAGRHQRVGGHVQEGAADVEVGLAPAHEQQCGGGVDDDADDWPPP